MNILDELAFGPGRDIRAWIRLALLTIASLALLGAIGYFTFSGDYEHLKASIYTGAPSGQYYAVGEKLAVRAHKKNGRLSVVDTAGSVENIKRLVGDPGHCIPGFGFVQDGVPMPYDAGLQTLGRLPQPESLLLFSRRGRQFNTFEDLRGASIGIGPEGSGTAYLMAQLLESPDLKELGLRPSTHPLGSQVELVHSGDLDLAAFVIDQNAPLVRENIQKYDLELVSPIDEEGLVSRKPWIHLGKIPAGFFNVAPPSPATDKTVAQVDTLVIVNSCVGRAQRVAFLSLLSEAFPAFVKSNPPPASKSQDEAPLADKSREFFANGEPQIADRYFPWLVNLMSPAYWIYLAAFATILLNASDIYSRYRLWRIDAYRERLEAKLRKLSGLGPSLEHMKALPADAKLKTQEEVEQAKALVGDFEDVRQKCLGSLTSWVTPMGVEMYYRYQESLIVDAQSMVKQLLQRSGVKVA